jgi:hypothetical protein
MSKPACSISEGTIKDLYLQRQNPPPHLVAQLLAFQISEFNPKEIMYLSPHSDYGFQTAKPSSIASSLDPMPSTTRK